MRPGFLIVNPGSRSIENPKSKIENHLTTTLRMNTFSPAFTWIM